MSAAQQARHTIFVTALEGGIGYWSRAAKYRWAKEDGRTEDLDGYVAHVVDAERAVGDGDHPEFRIGSATCGGEKYPAYRIDDEVMRVGVKRYIAWAIDHPNDYFAYAARCLKHGKWDDLDVDAEIADCVVQLALFGETIYG